MYLCMNVCVYICDTHCCCGFPSRASTPPHKAKATYPRAGSFGEIAGHLGESVVKTSLQKTSLSEPTTRTSYSLAHLSSLGKFAQKFLAAKEE